MYRQGRFPEPPNILNGSDAVLNVDFVGPLAQAQKRYHQTGGVQTSLAISQPIIQMNPEVLDYIDTDKLLKNVLDTNGFPQSAIREDDEVEQIRKQRAEAQMQAMQAQMQMQAQSNITNNFDKLNEPVKEGSPIQELSEQLTGGLGGDNE